MKTKLSLLLVLIGLLASGCDLLPDIPKEADLKLVSDPGKINGPLFNNMAFNYNRYVQPGDKVFVDWRTSKNQYNEPTGLSDDTRWRIYEVTVRCSERNVDDSVFWPDSYPENTMFWFPTWSGPIDVNGLPFTMQPLTLKSLQPVLRPNYPWDSCAPHNIPAGPEQTATIYVTAEAKYIEVSLYLPEDIGVYVVKWPGNPVSTSTSGGALFKRVDTYGDITITMPDGTVETRNIPIDWFYVDAVFQRAVGPAGQC